MKIQSLVRDQNQLIPVDVEVSFLPGLPTIQFLGLPDQVIKESIHRIKSAIRSQGFEFPKAQQVLVNLRPNHLKKSSRGIELAVAAGILWATEQVTAPKVTGAVLIYGELGLKGEVFEPEDLAKDFEAGDEVSVLTGSGGTSEVPFHRSSITSLVQLSSPRIIPAAQRQFKSQRPEFGLNLEFSPSQAQLLELIAMGEHSVLLAGPAGSGKSTLAKTVNSLLAVPSQEDLKEIFKNLAIAGEAPSWRPLVQPHHTTSPLGIIGGGVPPAPGEISRAHKGVLILDELLEFAPKVQEALREPMEEFCIRIRRGRYLDEFPADGLVISTTNLCPCGDWVPQIKIMCGRSLKKCQSYSERLSGPLVDRFQVVFFTKKREPGPTVPAADILVKLEKARVVREEWATTDARFLKPASRWNLAELSRDLSEFYMSNLFPQELGSRRRDLATLRVARTFADLDGKKKLEPEHVERALKWTHLPFESLKRLGC